MVSDDSTATPQHHLVTCVLNTSMRARAKPLPVHESVRDRCTKLDALLPAVNSLQSARDDGDYDYELLIWTHARDSDAAETLPPKPLYLISSSTRAMGNDIASRTAAASQDQPAEVQALHDGQRRVRVPVMNDYEDPWDNANDVPGHGVTDLNGSGARRDSVGAGGADIGAASSSRRKKKGRKPGVGFFRGERVHDDFTQFSVVLCGDGLSKPVVPPNLSQIVPGKAPPSRPYRHWR
ncbi:hypothetical protein CFC21_051321 [Triticum aestivum]|uniref:Uncharacterized protein n=2 Tax=Triticum aestivum TaxID=4565 RepID=A0A3B6HQD6_WHEAT|nr:hypothetical protein CFC21_051321 [Triticum aestivum]